MKKLIFTMIFVSVSLAFAEEHTMTIITYEHHYNDWRSDDSVVFSYIDNFCCVSKGEFLIRIKGSSVDDGIYVEFENPNYPRLSSKTGAWQWGYGVEGGPDSTKIVDKTFSDDTQTLVYEFYLQTINIFKDTYLRSDEINDVGRLALFCEVLNAFSKSQLRILRNTIYAIHGYKFKSADLDGLFFNCVWYRENPEFSEEDFTNKEKVYLTLIKQAEKNAK